MSCMGVILVVMFSGHTTVASISFNTLREKKNAQRDKCVQVAAGRAPASRKQLEPTALYSTCNTGPLN